ncbi:MAG: hypothetical protein K8W52_10545 [Deltaproteobacteria bacterium]|nr:hypothetical protein [Deltaproteobacteria bacterium]
MRWAAAVLVIAWGCAKSPAGESARVDPSTAIAPLDAGTPDAAPLVDGGPLPAHRDLPDVAAAMREILATHPRVIGFGELHARTDRAQVASSLAHFTDEVLPLVADQLSDLVLETWVVDKQCGAAGTAATAQVESAMRRPAATKSELATLVERARAAAIQPHAMRLTCADFAKVAPPGQELQIEILLDLITRELGRIAIEAVHHRDADPKARPLVATYGGALHNDLYPYGSVSSWSFAAAVAKATGDRYVEVDLYVPELARGDALSEREPWYPLIDQAGPDHVVLIERGPRSYIVLLPTTPGAKAP